MKVIEHSVDMHNMLVPVVEFNLQLVQNWTSPEICLWDSNVHTCTYNVNQNVTYSAHDVWIFWQLNGSSEKNMTANENVFVQSKYSLNQQGVTIWNIM